MALSAFAADIDQLVAFKTYCKAAGLRIGESYPEDKPNPGAHGKGSFHYDTRKYRGATHSCAADINYGAPGAPAGERDRLKQAFIVAESMGLGVTYNYTGRGVGSAGSHRTHLHADLGSYSNKGDGLYKRKAGDIVVHRTQLGIHGLPDNLNGDDTKKRLKALREASNYGGVDFPYGVEFTQDVVGTKQDDVWGKNSRAAHDETMEDVQIVWKAAGLYKGAIDKIWGGLMDDALARFNKKY